MNKAIGIIVSGLIFCVASVFADIERVSVSSTGTQADAKSFKSSISSDGRYVVFLSRATNLVEAGGSIGNYDIYVHDRELRTTEQVNIPQSPTSDFISVNPNIPPSINRDGRIVGFYATSRNNGTITQDVFIYHRDRQELELINIAPDGTRGTNSTSFTSQRVSISASGRFVAFGSDADNLVENDTNDTFDVFVRDRSTNITKRVSVSSTGEQANSYSSDTAISEDGRFVTYSSYASNLVDDDRNRGWDVFVHNIQTSVTELVSVSSSGVQGFNSSLDSSISADGRFIAFGSLASNLVNDDSNRVHDVFVHDRQLKKTDRVSLSSTGVQGNAQSLNSSINANGRFVAFYSFASNLVEGDTAGNQVTPNFFDVFVHDVELKKTVRVNISSTGEQANDISSITGNVLSADGAFVTFDSAARNLVITDTNRETDVFVAENPLANIQKNNLTLEILINNVARDKPGIAAQLSTGTQFKQLLKVTNDTPNRLYQVQVFNGGNLLCNFYALNPGESKQRCNTFQTVLEGDQRIELTVKAKVSGSSEQLLGLTDAYYTGINGVSGKLRVSHLINNIDADSIDQAQVVDGQQTTVQFIVENTGNIELYQVKTYDDPVSPADSGWSQKCVIGRLFPGEVRYCKRSIVLTEMGLNQSMGRAQARTAIAGASEVVNAANPTYFIVP